MLDLSLDAHCGSFHLQIECRLASEWVVIFGPSGSGKSTLLRILAGLPLPEPGRLHAARIALDGELITDTARKLHLKPGRRRTAMVSQQPALFPHLSVADNVAYGVAKLEKMERKIRVDEALESVDGSALIGRYPSDLSGGEAQRVALARALATQPRLLLLDEPLSALDGVASDTLLTRLQQWTTANAIQTVIATHNAGDAWATGAEVALVDGGRLTALGPAARVLAAERDRLLERLL